MKESKWERIKEKDLPKWLTKTRTKIELSPSKFANRVLYVKGNHYKYRLVTGQPTHMGNGTPIEECYKKMRFRYFKRR